MVGIEDQARALAAERAKHAQARAAAAQQGQRSRDVIVREFVDAARKAGIPTRDVPVLQEHSSGLGRSLREWTIGNSTVYRVVGDRPAWGPLVESDGNSIRYAVITADGHALRMEPTGPNSSYPRSVRKRGGVIVLPDPRAPWATPVELEGISDTLRQSMVRFLADRL